MQVSSWLNRFHKYRDRHKALSLANISIAQCWQGQATLEAHSLTGSMSLGGVPTLLLESRGSSSPHTRRTRGIPALVWRTTDPVPPC